jgi:hypothetical protein
LDGVKIFNTLLDVASKIQRILGMTSSGYIAGEDLGQAPVYFSIMKSRCFSCPKTKISYTYTNGFDSASVRLSLLGYSPLGLWLTEIDVILAKRQRPVKFAATSRGRS